MGQPCAPSLYSLGSLADLEDADSFQLEESPGEGAAALTGSDALQTLQRRYLQLQSALAESYVQSSRTATQLQTQLQDLRAEVQRANLEREAAAAQAEALGRAQAEVEAQAAALRGQALDASARLGQLLEQNAGLAEQHRLALERLSTAERQLAASQAEASCLQLAPTAAAGGGTAAEELRQALEHSQAEGLALRQLLAEAREEQLLGARALSTELRRSHALEELRVADMREIHSLQQRLAELHQM